MYLLIVLLFAIESSITYSPTSSICAGDTLNITCYVYPEDDVELQLYALLYLCTRDLPYSQRFTIDSTIPGYLVTGDIPVKGNSARLKITIHSYQYSESGCDIYCQGEYADGHHADSGAVSTTPPLSGSVQGTCCVLSQSLFIKHPTHLGSLPSETPF